MATTTRRYCCDRCGTRLKEGRWVFSTWTRKRYCWSLDACARRARRSRRS